MKRKQLFISGAVGMLLYIALPADMPRLDVLAIIATVFVAVRVLAIPVEELNQKRQETNNAFAKMRNDKPASVLIGSDGWLMVEAPYKELKPAK